MTTKTGSYCGDDTLATMSAQLAPQLVLAGTAVAATRDELLPLLLCHDLPSRPLCGGAAPATSGPIAAAAAAAVQGTLQPTPVYSTLQKGWSASRTTYGFPLMYSTGSSRMLCHSTRRRPTTAMRCEHNSEEWLLKQNSTVLTARIRCRTLQ